MAILYSGFVSQNWWKSSAPIGCCSTIYLYVRAENTRKISLHSNQVNNVCVYMRLRQKIIDGLAGDCNNSIADAMELLQSCAKPSKWWSSYRGQVADVFVCKVWKWEAKHRQKGLKYIFKAAKLSYWSQLDIDLTLLCWVDVLSKYDIWVAGYKGYLSATNRR